MQTEATASRVPASVGYSLAAALIDGVISLSRVSGEGMTPNLIMAVVFIITMKLISYINKLNVNIRLKRDSCL